MGSSLNKIVLVGFLLASSVTHSAIVVAQSAALTVDTVRPNSQGEMIFDGKTLEGWETISADHEWWSVQDGILTGGSIGLKEKVPHNTFLSTKKSYADFELTLKIRIRGSEGFVNSGVQIRSQRVPDSFEMSGYQVDVGLGWWGKLYDESRRNKVIAEPVDPAALNSVIAVEDWNEYRILAKGKRIQSWINGVPAIDYIESDSTIPLDGKIALQVHGDGITMVEFKDIVLLQK